MKQLYRGISILILKVTLFSGVAMAQKDTTTLNQSVDVMKAYHPSLAKANKVNLMPVIGDTTHFAPEFNYSIESRPINSGFLASSIQPADVNRHSYKDLGIGYLKLGAGTSTTAYGEFFLNLPESKSATFGLHLRHLSSESQIKLREGNKVDAPYSQSGGAIFGSVNIGSSVLKLDLSYDRNAMRNYGYPALIPAKIDSLTSHKYGFKQVYEKGDFKVALQSNDNPKNNLIFNSGVRLGFFNSKTGQKENSAGLFGKFDYNFEVVHGIIDFSYDHFTTDSIMLESNMPGTKNKDVIRIAPSVRLDGDNWYLRGGVNFVTTTDNTGEKATRLYPDFEFNFKPVEGILTLYAGFKGDLKNNRYSDISLENYWSDPRHNVRNTDYTYTISGGLKGKISREISYNLGIKFSQVKDLYFYTQNSYFSSAINPAPVYDNTFEVVYDNAKITNFSAEFSYVSGNDLSVIISGNYYNYKLDKLPFAPQKANFDLSAYTGVRIIDKLTGFADLGVIGMRQARVFNFSPLASPVSHDETFSIDPVIRLNLGATFELSTNLKLFGRVDNLLNRLNDQWLGYGSQGLRLMGGVSVSF